MVVVFVYMCPALLKELHIFMHGHVNEVLFLKINELGLHGVVYL